MELQGKDPSPSPTPVHGTSQGDIPNSHFQKDKILASKFFWHVPKEDNELLHCRSNYSMTATG